MKAAFYRARRCLRHHRGLLSKHFFNAVWFSLTHAWPQWNEFFSSKHVHKQMYLSQGLKTCLLRSWFTNAVFNRLDKQHVKGWSTVWSTLRAASIVPSTPNLAPTKKGLWLLVRWYVDSKLKNDHIVKTLTIRVFPWVLVGDVVIGCLLKVSATC